MLQVPNKDVSNVIVVHENVIDIRGNLMVSFTKLALKIGDRGSERVVKIPAMKQEYKNKGISDTNCHSTLPFNYSVFSTSPITNTSTESSINVNH